MSKKQEDFMRAMFPGSNPANKGPQPVIPAEQETIKVVKDEIVEEEPVEEIPQETEQKVARLTTDSVRKPAREKNTATEDNKPKSGKKSFIYFCWTSPEVDYKIREIARRYGISLSAMLGDIMEKAIDNFEKSNGEITLKERKSKKTARR